MLAHAVAWARQHGTGVAREVGTEFVAVLPDGRHARHATFHEALAWLDEQGSEAGLTYSGSSAQWAGARQSDDRISSRSRMNSFGSLS